MLSYINDRVVGEHTAIRHQGEDLFLGHRTYIEQIESFLSGNGGSQFVPLPAWDPASSIPAEFDVVKSQDNGNPRPPLRDLHPNLPLPPEFTFPATCRFRTADELGNAINGWHGSVHVAVGGTMSDFSIASAAPIFWCWHAFLDHVYDDWGRCGAGDPRKPIEPKPSEHEKHREHETHRERRHYEQKQILAR